MFRQTKVPKNAKERLRERLFENNGLSDDEMELVAAAGDRFKQEAKKYNKGDITMPKELNENDLNSVAGGTGRNSREIVTPQNECKHGLLSDTTFNSTDTETNKTTVTTFVRRCHECPQMSSEDGIYYCNAFGINMRSR